MDLAIFDLDNTLLGGDSDYLWGRFLVEQRIVDGEHYERENRRFYEEYKAGTLDIHAFLNFSLEPLSRHDPGQLARWRRQFVEEKIRPIILPAATRLVADHKRRGHHVLIITATNRFVTEPIAEAFGVHELIATDPEFREGRYTGRVSGTPCFREGKVERLEQWLAGHDMGLEGSWFYSDSHNDLPLLQSVSVPVAVDPDAALLEHARANQWSVITLRHGAEPVPYNGD